MGFSTFLKNFRRVFSNWKYVLLAVVLAFVFYSLNVLISSWIVVEGYYYSGGIIGSAILLFKLSLGFWRIAKLHSFVSLVILSFLFGIFLSLLVYKSRMNLNTKDKKVGIFGSVGVFLAALVPGCAACGVGILSVLGVGAGFLSFLPYEGLELSILAIGLLSFATWRITEKLDSCTVPNSYFIERGSKNERHN